MFFPSFRNTKKKRNTAKSEIHFDWGCVWLVFDKCCHVNWKSPFKKCFELNGFHWSRIWNESRRFDSLIADLSKIVASSYIKHANSSLYCCSIETLKPCVFRLNPSSVWNGWKGKPTINDKWAIQQKQSLWLSRRYSPWLRDHPLKMIHFHYSASFSMIKCSKCVSCCSSFFQKNKPFLIDAWEVFDIHLKWLHHK